MTDIERLRHQLGTIGFAQACAIAAERERCRRAVVDILSEEGWLGRSFERIMDAICFCRESAETESTTRDSAAPNDQPIGIKGHQNGST